VLSEADGGKEPDRPRQVDLFTHIADSELSELGLWRLRCSAAQSGTRGRRSTTYPPCHASDHQVEMMDRRAQRSAVRG
jgi:hypothetical protein